VPFLPNFVAELITDMFRRIYLFLAAFLILAACSKVELDNTPKMHGTDIFETKTIPEVHIEVSLSEWNTLLKAYDKDEYTAKLIHCDVRYIDDSGETTITDAGLRLHGNYSRVRPEGSYGSTHKAGSTNWHHFHFILNFAAFHDDKDHEVRGADKMLFKWFHEDRTYVREIYSYDLFKRDDIWTAADAIYSKIYIHVAGDAKEAYYGVYCMVEPVDKSFIKRRREFLNNNTEGFLWKCRLGASLNNFRESNSGIDDNLSRPLYTLKTNMDEYDAAVKQMTNFVNNLKNLKGQDYNLWMAKVCDVDLLLRTYAVNVTLGMWDDYWNNNNNYYLYFDSKDPENYKVYLIPYDYDNALGTCNSTGNVKDSGRADPFNWGLASNKWISKILEHNTWREIYRTEFLKLVDPEKELFDKTASQKRIQEWQTKVKPYVDNDTGEDCTIADRPASWGTVGNYRLLVNGSTNFFTVRTETIHKYCD